MKIDIDSYLYIVITIAILIITALGRKKKKPAQQTTGKPQGETAASREQKQAYTYNKLKEEQEVSEDPFERLEQLFVPKETPAPVEEEEEIQIEHPEMDR